MKAIYAIESLTESVSIKVCCLSFVISLVNAVKRPSILDLDISTNCLDKSILPFVLVTIPLANRTCTMKFKQN